MTDGHELPNLIAKVKHAPVQAYRGAHALEDGEVRRRLREIDHYHCSCVLHARRAEKRK